MSSQSFSFRRLAIPAFAPSMLFGLGEGAILPAIPLSARDLGGSVAAAAFMVTLIGIGSLLSNVPASWLTMRRGERWAIVAAAVWCVLAMALCAWTSHLVLFGVGSFMVGMSQSVFGLARLSYLTEAVPVAYRARALSTLGGVMRIGLFIGPFLAAAAIRHVGLSGAYGVGIAALVLAGVLAATMPDLPSQAGVASPDAPVKAGVPDRGSAGEGATSPGPTLLSTVRDHRHVFATLGIGVLLVSAVRASRQAVIPLWADHLAMGPALASLIYGVSAGIDMLVFYPAGVVMDRKGRNWVAVPSMLIMGLALLAMPLTRGEWTLLLAAAAVGFGNGIGSGMVMTMGADHSPPVGRAHFLGVWRLMSDIGSTLGPGLLSLLIATFSLASGVALTGLLAFAAAAQLAVWVPRLRQRALRGSA